MGADAGGRRIPSFSPPSDTGAFHHSPLATASDGGGGSERNLRADPEHANGARRNGQLSALQAVLDLDLDIGPVGHVLDLNIDPAGQAVLELHALSGHPAAATTLLGQGAPVGQMNSIDAA